MAAWGCDLYVISAGELTKVGRTKNVARRFKEICRAMPWADCTLTAVFPGSGFAEPWVHKALCDFERKGEWFKCHHKTVLKVITEVLP